VRAGLSEQPCGDSHVEMVVKQHRIRLISFHNSFKRGQSWLSYWGLQRKGEEV